MKTLNIRLDDKEFKKLKTSKDNYSKQIGEVCSWERFLIVLLKSYERQI